jgi:outer membrane immunogenic protein
LGGDFGYSHTTTTKVGLPGCANGCVGGPGVFFGSSSAGGDTSSLTLGWDAAALARLGFLATPDVLLYATGGVAWQSYEATGNCGPWQTSFYCGGPGQPNPSSVTQSGILTGWTAGGGAEWHAWGHWLLRAEYRFADFGTRSGVFAFGPTTVGDNTYRYQLKVQTQIGSIGLAYRF